MTCSSVGPTPTRCRVGRGRTHSRATRATTPSTATPATTRSTAAQARTRTTADAGFDLADYSLRTAAVTADLDGAADDGETVEADNVKPDVEEIDGGSVQMMSLTGNNGVNVIEPPRTATTCSIRAAARASRLIGGLGADTVTYAARTAAVSVDLDGVANDGEPGELDLIETNIENLTGSTSNDGLGHPVQAARTSSTEQGQATTSSTAAWATTCCSAGPESTRPTTRPAPPRSRRNPDGVSNNRQSGEHDDVETDVEGPDRRSGQRRPHGLDGAPTSSAAVEAVTTCWTASRATTPSTAVRGPISSRVAPGSTCSRAARATTRLRARDGASADQVRCAGDTDVATLDGIDDAATDCETRDRLDTTAPGPTGPGGPAVRRDPRARRAPTAQPEPRVPPARRAPGPARRTGP